MLARALSAQHGDNASDDANERDKNVQTDNTQEKWRIRRDNDPGYDRFVIRHALLTSFLQQENPQTVEKVKAVLEKHPWYGNQWQARLQDVSVADHRLVLFMQSEE